jgi:hypothetical protein
MLRTFSALLFGWAAACAGQNAAPTAATTPSPTTASTASVPSNEATRASAPDEEALVRDGMQMRSLAGVGPTFATYLNGMHNRIHPEFADKELPKLEAAPPGDPRNDKKLATTLELIVSAEDGHLVKIAVVKTSGVTAFDVAALDSVQRAQPFGEAPRAIASADGNVYVHWQFHRDDEHACSTLHSRPYLFGP